MAFDAHANLAVSTVTTAPSPASSGTTLSVGTGEGARFPAAPFNCTVWPANTLPTPANAEIIRVTSKGAGDNWTIVRETEIVGTARSILVGDYIAATITKKTLTDLEDVAPVYGTFTPGIGGSGGQSGQAYSIQVGSYVKIGRFVHAQFTIALSTLGTVTGNAQITGLPFASENVANQNASAVISYFSGLTTNVVWLSAFVAPNASVLQLFKLAAASTGAVAVVQADLSNTSALVGSVTYVAAS
jgi:hypothetical protein